MRENKIKVMFFISSLRRGGVESLTVDWVKTINKEKFIPVIVTNDDFDAYGENWENAGVERAVIDFRPIKNKNIFASFTNCFKNIFNIYKIIKRSKPHVLHINDIMMSLFIMPGALACRVPVKIMHRHNIIFKTDYFELLRNPNKTINFLAHRISSIFCFFSGLFFDRIYTVSTQVSEEMKEAGYPENKIEFLLNGVDIKKMEAESENTNFPQIKEKFGLNDSYPIIGAVGNIREPKGHEYLIRAIPGIKKIYPEVKVVIVGGWETSPEYLETKAKLDKLCDELNLKENVLFTGSRRVSAFIPLFDIACLPSIIEGLPVSLIEYMVFSKPIVATRIGGNVDIIKDGENGLLVEPENPDNLRDAILKLLKNPRLSAKIASQGREYAEKHLSIETMTKKMEINYAQFKMGE